MDGWMNGKDDGNGVVESDFGPKRCCLSRPDSMKRIGPDLKREEVYRRRKEEKVQKFGLMTGGASSAAASHVFVEWRSESKEYATFNNR